MSLKRYRRKNISAKTLKNFKLAISPLKISSGVGDLVPIWFDSERVIEIISTKKKWNAD